MIVQESTIIGGREFVKTYSNQELKIRQVETGRVFNEAYDVIPVRFTYEETNEPIDPTPTEVA